MDSLTHALVIAIALSLLGRPELIPYGIMGAVLIDVDVLFNGVSGRDPGLYIFTHGGFTHSFFGAFLVALFAAIPALILSYAGALAPFNIQALATIIAGAFTHIALDYLAYPGIPLFYPISDIKHTLGVLGGPSFFLLLASVAYLTAMAVGMSTIEQPWAYVAFFSLIMALCIGAKTYAAVNTRGRTIATLSPFKWMVIEDKPDAYCFYKYDFFKHASHAESYEKYKGLTPGEANKNDNKPEIKRLRYHSYIVTVEKNGNMVTYRDPLREKGHIWYPPYYKSHSVAVE